MRSLPILFFALAAFVGNAQNWALLNPAYRYNYSNDGSDTISNQIRVMGVDTLGVDSFRYELNRVGKVCDTCGDSCDVLIDIPQFLQSECRLGGGAWNFGPPEDLLIHPLAHLNDVWVFDPQNGTVGMLSEMTEETILGTQDSVRTMTTALGDTVSWSRSFGILHWHIHDQPSYRLIGVHGPQVGELVPTLQQFFRYQPGDVVQFQINSCSDGHCSSRYQKFEILQRIEQNGHIEFYGPRYERYVHYYNEVEFLFNPMYTWVLDSTNHESLRPLRSWPGQGSTLHLNSWLNNNDPFFLAKHYRDLSGSYIISGEVVNGQTLLNVGDTTSNNCLSFVTLGSIENNYRIDTQLGLRINSRSLGFSTYSFSTIGAIINGDTIGTLYNDAYFNIVGLEERNTEARPLFPDPASDRINVPQARAGSKFCIVDTQGRTVICDIVSDPPEIDIRLLQPGNYVLKVEDSNPQRFIIAR